MKKVPTVLAWYWRHYSLNVEDFDDAAGAVSFLRYGSDNGEMAPSGIEVDGVYTVLEDHPEYVRQEAESEAESEVSFQKSLESPRPIASIWIASPVGKKEWACVAYLYPGDDINLAEAEWRFAYRDRVKVEHYK